MARVDASPADPVAAFYDSLASTYDRLYPDWDAAAREQGDVLHGQVAAVLGPGPLAVVDVAVGIGTQLIGLAGRGHRMTGTDISGEAVLRAGAECTVRGIEAGRGVADMRALPFRDASFDVALCADNAVAHLLAPAALVAALEEMRRVTRPGGVVLVTVRDYAEARASRLPGTLPQVSDNGIAVQVWHWHEDGEHYDLEHYALDHDALDHDALAQAGESWKVTCRRTTMWALLPNDLLGCAARAGLTNAEWVAPRESGFFQPLMVARAPA
jgi:ubiquinone/menaquinone biosynthesis C-methylase UbiE